MLHKLSRLMAGYMLRHTSLAAYSLTYMYSTCIAGRFYPNANLLLCQINGPSHWKMSRFELNFMGSQNVCQGLNDRAHKNQSRVISIQRQGIQLLSNHERLPLSIAHDGPSSWHHDHHVRGRQLGLFDDVLEDGRRCLLCWNHR